MTRGLLDEIGMVSAKPDLLIEIDAEVVLAKPQRSIPRKPAHQSN